MGAKINCISEKGREDEADYGSLRAQVLAVGRNQGHDDPKPDEVYKDREKDDEDGRLSHAETGKAYPRNKGLSLQ